MTLKEFFQLYYQGMVNYCSGFGHNRADVEEMVSDVILRYFADFDERITNEDKYKTMKGWMNRRILYNLASQWRKKEILIFFGDCVPEQISLDDPMEMFSLKERLPQKVHELLLSYEPVVKGRGKEAKSARVHKNSSADTTRYCREKKKFLTFLNR